MALLNYRVGPILKGFRDLVGGKAGLLIHETLPLSRGHTGALVPWCFGALVL